MKHQTDPLRVMGGILLLLFGVCLIFVGGLCTWFIFGNVRNVLSEGSGIFMLSIGTFCLGLLSVVSGWRCLQPPRDG